MKFTELPIPAPLQDAITNAGFTDCTPIQEKSLPLALTGKDIAGQAQTGAVHRIGLVQEDQHRGQCLGSRRIDQRASMQATQSALPDQPDDDLPRRAIVADDTVASRTVMAGVLEAAGWAVRVASDGEGGLALLEEGPCDVVVTDVQMPRLDGFSLTRRIKQSAELSKVPVVILSSLASPEDKRRGLDAGRQSASQSMAKVNAALSAKFGEATWAPAWSAPWTAPAAPPSDCISWTVGTVPQMFFRPLADHSSAHSPMLEEGVIG